MKAAPIASTSRRPPQIMHPFTGRDILTPGNTIYKGGEQARAVKAVTYYSYDDIRVEQRPIPTITDHELLVQVHGCGLCGSDILKIVQRARPPVVLGHELTGTIVKRGKAIPTTVGTDLSRPPSGEQTVGGCDKSVPTFEVGQRVIVAHHVPCGTCHYCRHANYSMCARFKASNIDPCGFAEYIRVPAEHVQHATLLLPHTLSPEEGSFTEPLACCVRAVRRTPLLAGDTVVVVGMGSIGLLMIQAVKALGKRAGYELCVYGVDVMPERLSRARELGADDVFLAPSSEHGLRDLLAPCTEGRGADAIILTVGGTSPFLQALAGLRRGGILNIFAAYAGMVPVNIEAIYQQELTVLSTYSSSPEDLRIALDLFASRTVHVDTLISHRLPLEQFQEGVALMRERAALKVYFQIAQTAGGAYGK